MRLFGHPIFLGVLLKEHEILLEISIYRHCMNHALKNLHVHHFNVDWNQMSSFCHNIGNSDIRTPTTYWGVRNPMMKYVQKGRQISLGFYFQALFRPEGYVLSCIANTRHQVGTCFWRFFTFLWVLGGGLFSFIKENTSSTVS